MRRVRSAIVTLNDKFAERGIMFVLLNQNGIVHPDRSFLVDSPVCFNLNIELAEE